MVKRVGVIVAAWCMVIGLAAPGRFADATQRGSAAKDLKEALGLSLYLQGGYTFNLENPDSQENELRGFDHRANSFMLDLAQITLEKEAPAGGAGFKVKVSAGETAKLIHAAGLGEADDAFDITEAYITYVAQAGNGLRFDFGKMGTYIGAEGIEAKDNANYSRSFLYNFAQPVTHTGLKVGYGFLKSLEAALYIVNGWDNATDNNRAKSVGASVAFAPSEIMTNYFNVMIGPEQDNNTADNRFLFDWVGIINPMERLSVNINFDYGTEDNVVGVGDATWYGVSAIVRYVLSDTYRIAGRGEYFNDDDGARTGTAQELKEITLSGDIILAEGLIVRPEIRHDWSNERVFNGGADKTQDTIAVGLMYSW